MYIVFFRNSYLIYLLNNNQKNVEFQLIDIFEDELYLKYTKDLNINVELMLKEMDKEIQMNLDENHYTHRKEDFILLKNKIISHT